MSNKPDFVQYLCGAHYNGKNLALYRSTHPDKQIRPYFVRYETVSGEKMVPGYRCPTFSTQSDALGWYESFSGSKLVRFQNALDNMRLTEYDE